jgi:probable F420-dependent oxidoreductase
MIGLSTYGNHPEHLVPVAKHAESLGFEGIWVGEHILQPMEYESVHPYDEGKARPLVVTSNRTMYDAWVAVSAMLAATTRLKVTTGIYLLPLRHPVLTARAAITAHQISGGRFRLGVGSGWWKEEFENVGVPFNERATRYDEALRVLPPLLAGEVVENDGPHYPFQKLKLVEEPAAVPIIFGGTKGRALTRAATLGDGWYGPMVTADESIAIKGEIERLRKAAGRTNPFVYEARVRGEPSWDSFARYREAGFDSLIVPWETIQFEHGFDMTLEQKYRRLDGIARALGLKP